jgi:DNA-binding XRE family transcriptional regulator
VRVLLVARGHSPVPRMLHASLAAALAAWRAEGGGVWECFAFPADARVGFGVVTVADEATLRRLVAACPLAPFCELEALEVEAAVVDGAPALGRVVGLRAARLARGLSQAALAAQAGLCRATVSRVESGRGHPTASAARRLGAALGLDPRLVAELRPAVAGPARPPHR